MSTKPTEKKERSKLTPEELERRKTELTKYYKEESEFLKLQLEYETLLANIEDTRLRRMVAIMRQAQIAAGPPEESGEEPGDASQERKESIQHGEETQKEPIIRKLKTEKA